MHVTGEVEYDADVDALAGKAGTSSAGKDCSPCSSAGGEGGFDVSSIARVNDADGKLAVVGGVGGEECARAQIKEYVAAECGLELRLELTMAVEALMFQRSEVVEDGERNGAHEEMVRQKLSGCICSTLC